MRREDLLRQLSDGAEWDVIIIGGGATGLGCAVDAASRGLRTLLLEAHDIAKSTSSRSTKLVHGGVRYLAQGDVGLVREALHERGLMRRNAPHLTQSRRFIVPAYRWLDQPFYGSGMLLYDLLAGRLGLGRTALLSRAAVQRSIPTIEPYGLKGGVLYYDGQFDDARMAVALLRTFLTQGGVALTYAPVTGLLKQGERVRGVRFRDAEGGVELEAQGKVVINATGVYADDVRMMDRPEVPPMVRPSQGVHLVIDREFLPTDHALMIPRTDDGRVLFAIPWHGKTVVGTTDTPVSGSSIEPRPLDHEIEFLMSHARRYLSRDPEPSDVRSIFAGLRPLIKGRSAVTTAALSRSHTLVVAPSGLVTITGGKWTTYRHMAEQTIDQALKVAQLPHQPCVTAKLRLHGWSDMPVAGHLSVYGSDAPAVMGLAEERPELGAQLHERLPYLAAEVVWATRYELARTVEDVLSRRTRALLLDARASQDVAPRVAQLMAAELGFDQSWCDEQVRAYRELAAGYVLS